MRKNKCISISILIWAMIFVICSLIACNDEQNRKTTVPIYKGMTVSKEFPKSQKAMAMLPSNNKSSLIKSSEKNQENQNENNIYGDISNRNILINQEQPFDESSKSIEEKSKEFWNSIEPEQDLYYASQNQSVYITIKIDNPDNFEIMSFTLNGQKYSNYMFEDGSDMEHLILKVNIGNVASIIDYTIDAIKYVDGTDIKDVRMDGNKTVKIGIATEDQTYAKISNEQINLSSISFDVFVNDSYSLIDTSNGFVKAVIYDGTNLIYKDISIDDETSILFDSLVPNTLYQYGIVGQYDNLNGNGTELNWLFKKAVYTNTIVLYKDFQVTKEGASWDYDWNETFENKQFSEISLWQQNEKIRDIAIDATNIEGLKSNNQYTLKATYKNTQNVDENIEVTFTTFAKTTPIVSISNLKSAKDSIECDLEYTDADDVGNTTEVVLYDQENKVQSQPFSEHVVFSNLEAGKEYNIVVEYNYDLNDGQGEQEANKSSQYSTLVDSIVVDELVLLNNNVVRLGEELNLRAYFTNSSEIELTGIYVNGQKAKVVGGDRIESAIIKFVPDESGLCTFAIDRVDYIINDIEVSQEIDTSVQVEYPIYGDLNIAYTPVTISKYENTGDGTYLSFDNTEDYVVYKINDNASFATIGSGKYFTTARNITSIEYGYEKYGHTTQKCNYYRSTSIRYVTELKKIYTAEEFFAMTDGYYVLMNDLDLRSTQTESQIALSGIFDANGYTIRGLSNVIDTSKNEYFNLFRGGSIYDATFKELYVSVNSNQSLTVNLLGNVRLFNCTVRGDVILSNNSNLVELDCIENSVTYSLNVTIGENSTTQKLTATNKLESNSHITERNGAYYFDCEEGKVLLSYSDKQSSSYTVEENTFFVRSYAFANCTNLKDIVMPETVKYFYGCKDVFTNCTLESATMPFAMFSSMSLDQEKKSHIQSLVLFGNEAENVCIGEQAFYGYTNLTSITIPKGVTSIGDSCFYYCTSLTSVVLPDSITSIGEQAFYGCTSLTSITIPEGVTNIGDSCFCGYASLTSVVLPDSITSIGDFAFSNCQK